MLLLGLRILMQLQETEGAKIRCYYAGDIVLSLVESMSRSESDVNITVEDFGGATYKLSVYFRFIADNEVIHLTGLGPDDRAIDVPSDVT